MEAYGDLWCSCQIGDAFIDLSIHLFDTYTRSKVHVYGGRWVAGGSSAILPARPEAEGGSLGSVIL